MLYQQEIFDPIVPLTVKHPSSTASQEDSMSSRQKPLSGDLSYSVICIKTIFMIHILLPQLRFHNEHLTMMFPADIRTVTFKHRIRMVLVWYGMVLVWC